MGDRQTIATSRTRSRAGLVDPDAARFFLALGAVGELEGAAALAEVDLDRARRWAAALPRPPWLTRRGEAARRLFAVAGRALEQVHRRLQPGYLPDDGDLPLRDLITVAEHFFAAALRLDKDVATSGGRQREVDFDLDGWDVADDEGPADAAAGAPRAEASDC